MTGEGAMKKGLKDKCGTQDYINKVMASNYVSSGQWFPTVYLQQQLWAGGFHTTTKKVGDICNLLAEEGKLDKLRDHDAKGTARYRKKTNNRKWLTMAWRKKSNEEIGYVHPNSYC